MSRGKFYGLQMMSLWKAKVTRYGALANWDHSTRKFVPC